MSDTHRDFAPDLEIIDTPNGSYQMRGDDLMHVCSVAGDHTAAQAQAWVDLVRELRQQRGKKIRLLIDIRTTRNTEPEARAVYNGSDNADNLAAAAMVMGGGISRVVGNFALRLFRLDVPIRLFNSIPEALEWLESHS